MIHSKLCSACGGPLQLGVGLVACLFIIPHCKLTQILQNYYQIFAAVHTESNTLIADSLNYYTFIKTRATLSHNAIETKHLICNMRCI